MAGFGSELLFFVGLGYVVLGPRRMQAVLQRIARAKREFDKTRAEFASQFSTAVGADGKEPRA